MTFDEIQDMKSDLRFVTNIKGKVDICNFPMPIILNGNEKIFYNKDETGLAFILDVLMINPNDDKEYLCDIVFTGKNRFQTDLTLSFSEPSEVYVRLLCDYDEYGKMLEFIVHEENR